MAAVAEVAHYLRASEDAGLPIWYRCRASPLDNADHESCRYAAAGQGQTSPLLDSQGAVRISQYAYLDISSETVTAADVTAYLGMEPDKVRVRGSRRAEPPVPVSHSWSVACREPGLTLDIQISQVLDRVAPLRKRLRDLGLNKDVWIRLVIVRYFDDPEGEQERFDATITEGGALLEKLPGQHQLLGWYLDTRYLELLAYVNADIWADEYG